MTAWLAARRWCPSAGNPPSLPLCTATRRRATPPPGHSIPNPHTHQLVDNASEAINAIIRNLEPPLGADEWILDLSTAYGPFAELYAWLGSRTGVRTLTVNISWPVTGTGSFVEPVRAALSAARALNIRIAVISQISAYPAVVLPVAELVALLHERGIPVFVDGAHALGNVPVDLQAMGDPDWATWNLHN